eukprot:TRINITY_DN2131_c0_g3_i4.p1 TRINITY_DN2131_c0_g3~~TRINITY_DN2131_c0_g3_i4.p1  ORF type:complete len:169 (-),score=32.15 TRINITY_DN2131_c0_g3_i4:106-555(-)
MGSTGGSNQTPKLDKYLISIKLINADIHTAFDGDGLADAYVKVKGWVSDSDSSGKLFYTGPVGDHSLSPQWNHIKTIKFNPNKYCGLIFDMYDKDPILNSDDFIGRGKWKTPVLGESEIEVEFDIPCRSKENPVSKIVYATLHVEIMEG